MSLQIVNAINAFPDAPIVDVNLSEASDLNGDGVVLNSSITYEGTTRPDVTVKVERLEGENSTTLQNSSASSTGTLQRAFTTDGAHQSLAVHRLRSTWSFRIDRAHREAG